eukprot:scaffold130959_cov36-Phaeocystis_antarctica.AAC.2
MGLPGAVQAGVLGVGRRGRQQAFSKTLNGLPRCDAGGCSGRVGVCRSAGVASSLLPERCRSGRVGVQECAG